MSGVVGESMTMVLFLYQWEELDAAMDWQEEAWEVQLNGRTFTILSVVGVEDNGELPDPADNGVIKPTVEVTMTVRERTDKRMN